MKHIPKNKFDKVVSLSREYFAEGDTSLLKERINIAMEIRRETEIDWLAIIDFVDSIIRDTGILPRANNEMLYILLRVLGWEVVDEVKESESL